MLVWHLHFSAGLSLDAANPRDLVWIDGHAKHRSLSGNSGSGLNLKLGHRDRHVRFTDRIFPGLNQSRPGRRYHHFWSSERIWRREVVSGRNRFFLFRFSESVVAGRDAEPVRRKVKAGSRSRDRKRLSVPDSGGEKKRNYFKVKVTNRNDRSLLNVKAIEEIVK